MRISTPRPFLLYPQNQEFIEGRRRFFRSAAQQTCKDRFTSGLIMLFLIGFILAIFLLMVRDWENGVVLLLFALTGWAFPVYLLVSSFRERRRLQRLCRTGQLIKGELIKTTEHYVEDSEGGGEWMVTITFAFQDPSGRKLTQKREVPRWQLPLPDRFAGEGPRRGRPLRIWYLDETNFELL